MDCETAAHGPLENGVQRNASRFETETEKNVNITLVTSDPFATPLRPLWQWQCGPKVIFPPFDFDVFDFAVLTEKDKPAQTPPPGRQNRSPGRDLPLHLPR